MATVILSTDLARVHTGGETNFEVQAATMRRLVRALDERFPGLGAALGEGMAVAIDGGKYPDIDMRFSPEGYFRRDGSRYETERVP